MKNSAPGKNKIIASCTIRNNYDKTLEVLTASTITESQNKNLIDLVAVFVEVAIFLTL